MTFTFPLNKYRIQRFAMNQLFGNLSFLITNGTICLWLRPSDVAQIVDLQSQFEEICSVRPAGTTCNRDDSPTCSVAQCFIPSVHISSKIHADDCI